MSSCIRDEEKLESFKDKFFILPHKGQLKILYVSKALAIYDSSEIHEKEPQKIATEEIKNNDLKKCISEGLNNKIEANNLNSMEKNKNSCYSAKNKKTFESILKKMRKDPYNYEFFNLKDKKNTIREFIVNPLSLYLIEVISLEKFLSVTTKK